MYRAIILRSYSIVSVLARRHCCNRTSLARGAAQHAAAADAALAAGVAPRASARCCCAACTSCAANQMKRGRAAEPGVGPTSVRRECTCCRPRAHALPSGLARVRGRMERRSGRHVPPPQAAVLAACGVCARVVQDHFAPLRFAQGRSVVLPSLAGAAAAQPPRRPACVPGARTSSERKNSCGPERRTLPRPSLWASQSAAGRIESTRPGGGGVDAIGTRHYFAAARNERRSAARARRALRFFGSWAGAARRRRRRGWRRRRAARAGCALVRRERARAQRGRNVPALHRSITR